MNKTIFKEIPEGYQRTPVGIIPKNWEVKKLGEVGDPKMCRRVFKDQTTSEGDIPFYKIGTFGKQADAFISNELFNEYKLKYSYPKEGDILISASGTIGRLVVYNGEPSYFQDSNIVWVDNKEDVILNKLLYYIYSRVRWKKTDGGIITRLYNKDLKSIQLSVPPIPEQERIASCLTTWDKGIEKLSTLIEAKKQQKKGLMQGLFNGQLTMDNGQLIQAKDGENFTESWKEVMLGDISTKKSSSLQANSITEDSGNYNVYGASGLLTKIDSYDEEQDYIAIVKDGSGVGNMYLLEKKSSVLGTLDKILPKKSNLYFLYCLLNRINFGKYKVGGAIPHIYYKDYSREKVLVPSLDMQSAIAKVLSTVDKEIALLKRKLETMQSQKKGLMQVLLTGKKRLV